MISFGISLFGRFRVFALLACSGWAWMLAAQVLAGDLARERHAWQAATLLVLSAIGLGLTALAFWPPDPAPLPAVLWRVLIPA